MEKLNTELGTIHYFYKQAATDYPTIIFFPSSGGDSTFYNFKNIIERLENNYGILAIDTIGTGLSSDSFMERSSDNILENYVDVINYEKPEKIILFAHSIGCIYALLLENHYDFPILKIFLLEPPHTGISEELLEETEAEIKQFDFINPLKKQNKISYKNFMDTINPKNSYNDKRINAKLLFNVFGNKSLISESKNFPSLLEKMATLENYKCPVELHILVSNERHAEYKNSKYNNKGTLHFIDGNHFLHWSNEDKVLNLINASIS